MKRNLLVLALACVFGTSAFAADVVWIEGETAVKNNLKENSWLKGDNPKLLSGGDMLAALNTRTDLPKPAFVLWKIQVAKEGTYHMYMRHGFKAHMGEARYRFVKLDAEGKPVTKPGPEEGWINLDLDAPSSDRKAIGQWRTIEWSRLDPVKLEAGAYYLDMQITGPNPEKTSEANAPVWTVIDVICLTTEPFTPNGDTKPGDKPSATTNKKGDDSYY